MNTAAAIRFEPSDGRMLRRSLWWLVPLAAIFLLGMLLQAIQVQIGAPAWAVVLVVAGGLVSFGVGAFIGVRRPEARVGQLFALAAAGFAINPTLTRGAYDLIPAWAVEPLIVVGTILSPIALASVCWVVALFPDGRHPSPRWRWVSWYLAAFIVGYLTSRIPLYSRGEIETMNEFSDVVFGVVMVSLVASLASQFFRYRGGSSVVRAQLRWFLWAVSAYVVFLLAAFRLFPELGAVESAAIDGVAYNLIPIAMAFAILRHRLYDIDRVISRTLAYAIAVGALVLVYAGLVVSLRGLLPVEGDLPVAVSTLVVALAFLPLVRRLQRVVDRRFFRSRYDASVVVARVAEELRSSLDLEQVTARAEAVVSEVFAPEGVMIWVTEQSR